MVYIDCYTVSLLAGLNHSISVPTSPRLPSNYNPTGVIGHKIDHRYIHTYTCHIQAYIQLYIGDLLSAGLLVIFTLGSTSVIIVRRL